MQRRHHGVYTVGPLLPTPFTAAAAALLAVPSAVALAGHSAAAVWRVPVPAQPWVEVIAISGRGTSVRGIRARRTSDLPARDVTIRGGLPVTSAARTLADLSATLTPVAVRKAVDEAFIARLVTDSELAEVLERRRSPVLADVLAAEHGELTRSDGERRMLALIREAGLPPPLTNVALHGFTVDFYWPEHGLVVELDGRPYHSRHAAFERDRRKDQTLRRHGLQPLRITGAQLSRHPMRVAVLIAENL
jgi:hypothetical protein